MNIRTISPSDFDFVIELAASEKIKYTQQDLTRILDYEPDGCFIATDGEKQLGIVSTITFGRVGWIGNLFVAKQARSRGTGTKLAKECLKYMQSRGVEFPKLYCFPNRVTFYRRLGFVTELNIEVSGGSGSRTPFTDVEQLRADSLDELIDFDEGFFGANRSKMLRRLYEDFGEYCFAAYADEKLVGYIMASGSEGDYEVGPWVCDPKYQGKFAEELLKAEINKLSDNRFELSSPMHNTLTESIIENRGLESTGVAVRMGFKQNVPIGITEGILGIGGLDRG